MATTSGTRTAGTAASGGQGGNGRGRKGRVVGLVATAALGLSLLTGLVLSQDRQAAQPAAPAAAVNPAAVADPFVADQFTYREDHRVLAPVIDFGPTACGSGPCLSAPDLTLAVPAIDLGPLECGVAPCTSAPAFVPDQFTYREDHRVGNGPVTVVPDSAVSAIGTTAERQRFLEANLWFPASAAPATIPSAERANLR